MGPTQSTIVQGGTLKGAYPPPVTGVVLPAPPAQKKSFQVTPEKDKRPGQIMSVRLNGVLRSVRIPDDHIPGSSFVVNVDIPQIEKVIASTLPSIPGMAIVQTKPIIFSSVCHSYTAGTGTRGQETMGKQVEHLLQKAQEKILEEAIKVGCNAILGMTFNITNDSSGDRGHHKMVMVTACGTPCSVVPMAESNLPIVEATACIEPLYNG